MAEELWYPGFNLFSTEQLRPDHSMKMYQIQYPTVRVVPPRQLETGDRVARDLETRQGQLLYPADTELTLDHIMKIKKFDVRRVPLRKMQEEWVKKPELSERNNRYDSAEVLDTREIPDDDQEELGKEREELAHTVFSMDSPGQAREVLELLRSVLDWSGKEEDPFQTLDGNIQDFQEDFEQLITRLDSVEDEEILSQVLSAIEGLTNYLEPLTETYAVSDDLLDRLQNFVDQRESIRSDLLTALDEGQIPKSGQKNQEVRKIIEQHRSPRHLDVSTPEDLPDSLKDLLGSEFPLDNLPSVPDSFQGKEQVSETEEVDADGDSSDPSDTDRYQFLESLAQGDWEQGLGKLMGFLREQEPDRGRMEQFKRYLVQHEKLRENQSLMLNQLEERLDDPSLFNQLESVLEGEQSFELKPWIDSDLDREDFEQFKEVVEQRSAFMEEFWSDLQPFLKEMIGETDNPASEELQEALTKISEQIRVQPRSTDGTNGGASNSTPPEKQLKVIRSALSHGDTETLSKQSGLPESMVESIHGLFAIPKKLNKWQEQLIKQFKEIVDRLLFLSVVNRDLVNSFVERVRSILDSHTKPLELLIGPDPRAHLLIHQYNVSILTQVISRHQGWDDRRTSRLVMASGLIDCGLAAIPESLYMKDGDLTHRGWQEVYKHPLYSEMFAARTFGETSEVCRLIREHHERLDATGYPDRKRQEDQHPLTPYLVVADVYSALLEERTYRDALAPSQALEQIRNQPKQFSDQAVKVLEEAIGYYPNGTVVLLNSGEIALVRKQNEGNLRRPSLLIFTDENRNKLDLPQPCDLSQNESVEVGRVLKPCGL